MKKSYIFANTMRGVGFCFFLCPMTMCWTLSFYHIGWFIALVLNCIGSYLIASVYVREFDNRRIKSSVYNLTGIVGCALALTPFFMSGSLPHYMSNMTLYSAVGAAFVLYAIACRPAVKESIDRQDGKAARLHIAVDNSGRGILVHPGVAKQLGIQQGDPVEVVGGFMSSRYTLGDIQIGDEKLDTDKVYLSAEHFKVLSLKHGASVKVNYYKPTEVSESIEGGMNLAVTDAENLK